MEIPVHFALFLMVVLSGISVIEGENFMRHLELFAVAIIMAALSGCISLGSGQPGPPGPKGDSSNTTVIVPQKN
jgi:hypothetical protein